MRIWVKFWQREEIMFNEKALKKLQWHEESGDRIIVVSASAAAWIEPWTSQRKIELISTILELKEGKVTGRIRGKNCYGPEKVKRLEEILATSDYDEIYVYGDSRGDKEMLAIATNPFFRKFD